jgi:hypothetical protein
VRHHSFVLILDQDSVDPYPHRSRNGPRDQPLFALELSVNNSVVDSGNRSIHATAPLCPITRLNKDNVVIVIFIPAIKLERLIAGADQRCSALLRFDPAAGIVLEIR